MRRCHRVGHAIRTVAAHLRQAAYEAQAEAAWDAVCALRKPALELVSAMIRERFPEAATVTLVEDGDDDASFVSVDSVRDADGQELDVDISDVEDAEMVLRDVAGGAGWVPEVADGAEYDRRRGTCTFPLPAVGA